MLTSDDSRNIGDYSRISMGVLRNCGNHTVRESYVKRSVRPRLNANLRICGLWNGSKCRWVTVQISSAIWDPMLIQHIKFYWISNRSGVAAFIWAVTVQTSSTTRGLMLIQKNKFYWISNGPGVVELVCTVTKRTFTIILTLTVTRLTCCTICSPHFSRARRHLATWMA